MGGKTKQQNGMRLLIQKKLFEEYERILRMNGVAVLFSQEPYTSHLRTFKTVFYTPDLEKNFQILQIKKHLFSLYLQKNTRRSHPNYFSDYVCKVKVVNINNIRERKGRSFV